MADMVARTVVSGSAFDRLDTPIDCGEIQQRGRPGREVARLPEVPFVAACGPLVHRQPRVAWQRLGQRSRRVQLHLGARDDQQLRMTTRDVEVVDPIAEEVAVGEDARPRLHFHLELQAALRTTGGRPHAQFHHRLADR